MKIIEAIKNLTNLSTKINSKEQASYGNIVFLSKKNVQSFYVSSSTIQCIINLDDHIFNTGDSEFSIDGKMILRSLSECSDGLNNVTIISNADNAPSAISIKSVKNNFEISVPISSVVEPIKIKKNVGSKFSVNKQCFIDLVKSTIFAGNEVDPDRPYFYALFDIAENNMSCTCGNGTFFTFASCKDEGFDNNKLSFLVPIGVLNNIMPIMSSSVSDQIEVYIDKHSISFVGKEFKIHISIDSNSVAWPNAYSVFNRSSGVNLQIDSKELINFASKLDIAIESYTNKSDTLKCNMSVKGGLMAFNVDATCKVKYDIALKDADDFSSDVFFDAACMSLTMKNKNIGESITVNIDDSNFNGRASPIVFSTQKDKFVFKTFFAVNI